jgi:hypothetical protein
MSFRWRLETLKEHWRDNAGNIYRSICSRVSGSHVVALLSLAAAIGSTVATFLAWDAARNANQVSLASQALALKVYNDQIALGHPSISVLSGETNVAATRQSGYRSAEVRDYAASLVLRNSGQRDAPRAWVALSSDSFVADLSRAHSRRRSTSLYDFLSRCSARVRTTVRGCWRLSIKTKYRRQA